MDRNLKWEPAAFGHVPALTGARRACATICLAGVLVALAACAAGQQDAARTMVGNDLRHQEISAAIFDGKPAEARERLATVLRTQPQNGYLHLLTGLTYQMEGDAAQSLELAKVGYDAAVKFAPGHYWSHYLAGCVALDLSDYADAAEHFSAAILHDPDRPQAFVGLAVAAYFARELDLAQVAADRALKLAPRDAAALRTAAYVAAARGEGGRVDAIVAKAVAVPSAAIDLHQNKPRLTQLLRTAALAQVQDSPATQPVTAPAAQPANPPAQVVPAPPADANAAPADIKQVMVEVTLLLNQGATTHNTGINLLDGLTWQFGVGETVTETDTTGSPDTTSRVFTTALRIPDITYSLNLFNTRSDYYRVIARPSLVAYLGEQSEFFIGRTVNVGVSGVNLGTLQPIDIGISVKVTPSELTADHAKFKVEVIRSFSAQDIPGTFQQSLTTFKQTVSATAEVDFGKTLILSGLYEAVDTGSLSKTPALGDVPVIDTLFNARTRTQRRDVALVLLTPRLAGAIATNMPAFRGSTLDRVLALWKDLIDPATNMDAIIETIGKRRDHKSQLFGPISGDLRLSPTSDPVTVRSVVTETMAQLR